MRWRKWLVTSDFFHPNYFEREYNMDSEKIAPDIEAENVIEVQEMEMEQVEMNKEIQSKLQIANIWGVIAHNLFPITYGP